MGVPAIMVRSVTCPTTRMGMAPTVICVPTVAPAPTSATTWPGPESAWPAVTAGSPRFPIWTPKTSTVLIWPSMRATC